MTLYCQNGWPVLMPGSSKLHTWIIPADNGHLTLTLRQGSAGFIQVHNALRIAELVEDLTLRPIGHPHADVVRDDWGAAVRPIRGQSTGYSNHAGGTADDLNATRHPLGVRHTWTPAQVEEIRHTLTGYGGCLGWGGNYLHRVDPMHWEIVKNLAACERVARDQLDSPRGRRIIEANPGQRAVILS